METDAVPVTLTVFVMAAAKLVFAAIRSHSRHVYDVGCGAERNTCNRLSMGVAKDPLLLHVYRSLYPTTSNTYK